MTKTKKTQKRRSPILDAQEPHMAVTNDGQLYAVVTGSEFKKALASGRRGLYLVALDAQERKIALSNLVNAALETASGVRAEFVE